MYCNLFKKINIKMAVKYKDKKKNTDKKQRNSLKL